MKMVTNRNGKKFQYHPTGTSVILFLKNAFQSNTNHQFAESIRYIKFDGM